MKKLSLCLWPAIFAFILSAKLVFSQNYSYALISNIQIGSTNSSKALKEIVRDINNRPDIKFTVLTGNITEDGFDLQFEKVKSILDSLHVPYYVLPGLKDMEYNQSAGLKFDHLFSNGNFSFGYDNVEHIGLNTGLMWNNYGHVSKENLKWLDSTLKNIHEDKEIIFYSYFPLNSDIDNWYAVMNILRKYKHKELIFGLPVSDKSNGYQILKSASPVQSNANLKSWQYNIITESPDTLFFSSINNEGKIKKLEFIVKDTLEYSNTDTLQFIDYTKNLKDINPKINVSLLWKKDLNKTLSSIISGGDDRIYATTYTGNIICYDKDGNELWQYKNSEKIVGNPVESGSNLIFGTLQGDLISLNAINGDVIQSIGLGAPVTSSLVTLNGENNGEKTTGVLAGTANGDLYFYDINTFEMIWENHTAKGIIASKPLIVGNRIVYGSGDGYIYCIDGTSGIINWKWTDKKMHDFNPSSCIVTSDGNNVYVGVPGGNLSAVDLMLGKSVWTREDIRTSGAVSISSDHKLLFIKSNENYFFKIIASVGKIIKRINLNFGRDLLQDTPVEFRDNILFCSQNGNIYIIDSRDKWDRLFFLGNAPAMNIVKLSGNLFIAGNKDGKLIAFIIN